MSRTALNVLYSDKPEPFNQHSFSSNKSKVNRYHKYWEFQVETCETRGFWRLLAPKLKYRIYVLRRYIIPGNGKRWGEVILYNLSEKPFLKMGRSQLFCLNAGWFFMANVSSIAAKEYLTNALDSGVDVVGDGVYSGPTEGKYRYYSWGTR